MAYFSSVVDKDTVWAYDHFSALKQPHALNNSSSSSSAVPKVSGKAGQAPNTLSRPRFLPRFPLRPQCSILGPDVFDAALL